MLREKELAHTRELAVARQAREEEERQINDVHKPHFEKNSKHSSQSINYESDFNSLSESEIKPITSDTLKLGEKRLLSDEIQEFIEVDGSNARADINGIERDDDIDDYVNYGTKVEYEIDQIMGSALDVCPHNSFFFLIN